MTVFHMRRAIEADAESLAALHRAVRQVSMPYLPALHTPDEDLEYFRNEVLQKGETWVAQLERQIVGFCHVGDGWVNHLYVDQGHQGQGVGSAMLRLAMQTNDRLRLWVFQRNTRAIAFYERHGFSVIDSTDGRGNEEREPDLLLLWTRDGSRLGGVR